ncbi:hypothetical protein RFI_22963 [Reticulomyxa filosa]|uniref:Uncharacterized protein n=1 Tax=Reticulomyxa filosa TaxID=46433 RepID=X6MK91_RETFI|nr:hypothetical protein RFI_22963 [Reticulomyxa filosa]|eukprot:ETO14403.1 hypothetical protein RFI_22963 [Reticulomyxa filosa]
MSIDWSSEWLHHVPYFLVHISKAAGSTICETLQKLGIDTPSDNCNFKPHGVPIGVQKDPGSITCNQMRREAFSKVFFANEAPLSGHVVNEKMDDRPSAPSNRKHGHVLSHHPHMFDMDNFKMIQGLPYLCPEFQYILPLRQPLERIFSWLRQMNLRLTFPYAFLVHREGNWTQYHDKECQDNTIHFTYPNSLNVSRTFTRMTYAKDMKGFISELFYPYTNATVYVQKISGLYKLTHFDNGNNNDNRYDRCDTWHLTRYVDNIWLYPFKETVFNSRFLWKSMESTHPRMNLHHIRGYCNNIYTRWLGFEHSTDDIIFDTILSDANDEYDLQMYRNAIHTLLKVNHVLPFGKETKGVGHPIWDVLLQWIRIFAQTTYRHTHSSDEHRTTKMKLFRNPYLTNSSKVIKWLHSRDSSDDTTFSTDEIMKYVTSDEWALLKRFNYFDMKLYHLSKRIADIDVFFYEYVGLISLAFH